MKALVLNDPLPACFWTFPCLQHTRLKPSAHHRASSQPMNVSLIFALYLARLAFYPVRWIHFACCFDAGQVANGGKNTRETFLGAAHDGDDCRRF